MSLIKNRKATKFQSRGRGLENLERIDQELKDVFASLSPSLEALAELAPNDQVKQIKSLILDLKYKAGELADENLRIKGIVDRFEGKISPVDGAELQSSYIANLYQKKIMNKRLEKISDPNCNKQIQCRRIDPNLCKETQTRDLQMQLTKFIEEKKERRIQELRGYKVLEAGQFIPAPDEKNDYDQLLEATLQGCFDVKKAFLTLFLTSLFLFIIILSKVMVVFFIK